MDNWHYHYLTMAFKYNTLWQVGSVPFHFPSESQNNSIVGGAFSENSWHQVHLNVATSPYSPDTLLLNIAPITPDVMSTLPLPGAVRFPHCFSRTRNDICIKISLIQPVAADLKWSHRFHNIVLSSFNHIRFGFMIFNYHNLPYIWCMPCWH